VSAAAAPERLRRILVMVPWLLDHPGVAVDEVADRFGVTPGDVVDDLDVLGYCGLPGYGGGDLIETSVAGGRVVVRMADFFARPLDLTVREAVALLLAARTARAAGLLGEDVADGPLQRAIATLEQHLGADADVPVAVDAGAQGDDLLERLRPAVEGHRVVRLVYRSASKEETTTRHVEPWSLSALDGAWYLQGHCRLAGGPRSFHLDRVADLEVTDEVAPAPGPLEVAPPVYEPRPGDPEVLLEVAPGAAWVAEGLAGVVLETAGGGWTRLRFRAATIDWAARLVLQLGPAARVVDPPALADRARERARALLTTHSG
jgi:predicted DNA-binding transcriptional regulator YafY